MLITRRFWPPLWHSVFPAEDRAFVHCCHLMTVILNPRRMLSRFCLHSYQNEVLGGPRLSITQGSSCSRVFGPASTARLTNCLWIAASKAPSTPFCHRLLTNAPRPPLPDTRLLLAFCSPISDGLLCILARLTVSWFLFEAAGSPAFDRVLSKSQLYGVQTGLVLHWYSKFSRCFITQDTIMEWMTQRHQCADRGVIFFFLLQVNFWVFCMLELQLEKSKAHNTC